MFQLVGPFDGAAKVGGVFAEVADPGDQPGRRHAVFGRIDRHHPAHVVGPQPGGSGVAPAVVGEHAADAGDPHAGDPVEDGGTVLITGGEVWVVADAPVLLHPLGGHGTYQGERSSHVPGLAGGRGTRDESGPGDSGGGDTCCQGRPAGVGELCAIGRRAGRGVGRRVGHGVLPHLWAWSGDCQPNGGHTREVQTCQSVWASHFPKSRAISPMLSVFWHLPAASQAGSPSPSMSFGVRRRQYVQGETRRGLSSAAMAGP